MQTPKWASDASGLKQTLIGLNLPEGDVAQKVIEYIFLNDGPDLRYMIDSLNKTETLPYYMTASEIPWLPLYFKPKAWMTCIIGGYLSRLSTKYNYVVKPPTISRTIVYSANSYCNEVIEIFRSMLDDDILFMRKYRL